MKYILILILSFFILFPVSAAENFHPKDAEATEFIDTYLCSYRKNGYWGLYDRRKGILTPTIYDKLESFDSNYVKTRRGNYYGLLNGDGETIVRPKYLSIYVLDTQKYVVETHKGFGIINSEGEVLVDTIYDSIKILAPELYKVCKDGRYGAINPKGTVVIPIMWNDIDSLVYQRYKVLQNGKYGVVTPQGSIVLRPEFAYIEPIVKKDNRTTYSVCVCKNINSECGVVNSNGGIILPCIYNGILTYLSNGYFILNSYGKYGVVDAKGNKILDCKFTGIDGADDNVIYTRHNKLYGLADKIDGRIITNPIYTKIETVSQPGYYKVKEDGKWGILNYDGTLTEKTVNGFLKINKVVKILPLKNRYAEKNNYNSYYAALMSAEYKLLAGENASIELKKLMSVSNKHTDIKNAAQNLMKKYGI